MAQKVGGIFVSMSASAGRFTKDMNAARSAAAKSSKGIKNSFNSARKSTSKFSGGIGKIKGAAIAAAGPAALGLLIKKSIETADNIAKTADAIGISTDMLQELQFAADLAGISQDTLNSALKAFTKRVGEARSDTGTLVTILKKMDEELLNNVQSSKSAEDAFDLIINAAADMENPLDRAALLAAAFGRTAGVEMANMIKGGTKSLDDMRQKARDLGLVIDEDLLRNAEQAKDALTIMGRVISTKVTSAVLTLAPQITNLADRITDGLPALFLWVQKFLEWTGIIDKDPLAVMEANLSDLNKQLKTVEDLKDKRVFEFAETADEITIMRLKKQIEELTAKMAPLKKARDEAFAAQQALSKQEAADAVAALQTASESAQAQQEKKKSLEEFSALHEKLTTDQFDLERQKLDENLAKWKAAGASQEELATVKTERLKQIAQDEADFEAQLLAAKQQLLEGFNQVYAKITTDRFELERQKLAENLEKLKEAGASQTEMDRYEAEERKRIALEEFQYKLDLANQMMNAISNLGNQMLELEKANIQTDLADHENAENRKFKDATKRIKRQYSVGGKLTEEGLAKQAALEEAHLNTLGVLRDDAARKEKQAAKKMKPVKIAQAVSDTALAVVKALSSTIPPFNFALAALVGAAGAAQIATIHAQPYAKGGIVNSPTYFQHGGEVGLMGEAGAEAILPLTRMSGGDLGVQASGGQSINLKQNFYFYGITEEQFINSKVIPQVEDAARKGITSIMTKS